MDCVSITSVQIHSLMSLVVLYFYNFFLRAGKDVAEQSFCHEKDVVNLVRQIFLVRPPLALHLQSPTDRSLDNTRVVDDKQYWRNLYSQTYR